MPSKVANVPVVGKMSVEAAVVFKVIEEAFKPVVPVVVNAAPVETLPPNVMVLLLATPVPPFAGAMIPEI